MARKNLTFVPKNKLIFVLLHSPTKSRYQSNFGNSSDLHSLLAGYKDVHILSGHTHYNSVLVDGTGITEHNVGAVCGGWWERPVCVCGTYLGYKIFEIDGISVRWKYRAHQYPQKQFSVFKPGARASALRPATRTYDPLAYEYFGASGDASFPPGRTWIGASPTDHIFACVHLQDTPR